MIRTIAYALVDQQGNPSSVYLEHERAMSAVAGRRGTIVQDLVLRETAVGLLELLVAARDALAGDPWDYAPDQDKPAHCQSLIDRINAELRRTA